MFNDHRRDFTFLYRLILYTVQEIWKGCKGNLFSFIYTYLLTAWIRGATMDAFDNELTKEATMLNRQYINETTIRFEDFISSSQTNKIGDHVEVSMGGPYTASRFAISRRLRHPTDATKIVLVAKLVVSHAGYVADPVSSTVTKCGAVVAHIVCDDVCKLVYVGTQLDDPKDTTAGCGDGVLEALKDWLSKPK